MRRRSSPPFNFHNNGSGDKWSPPDDKKSIKSIRQSVEEKPKEKSKEYVPKCCAKSAALLPEEQKYHPKIRPETAPGTAEIVDVDSRGNDVVTPTSDRTCTPPVPPIRISKTKIGITVNPSPIPKPVQKVTPPIEKRPKKKWPYNWRLEQLAKPAHFTSKYVPRVEQRIGPFIKKRIKLDPELSFYMNQLFRPHIRFQNYYFLC